MVSFGLPLQLIVHMDAVTDAPLAIWYWKTDQGHWHAYSDALCHSLEDAWSSKATRFPVDAERFVDTVKMEQRRLDLTGKARMVKREPQLELVAHIFAAVGKQKFDVLPLVSQHGGIVTKYITEKVSFVVCDSPLLHANELAEAKSLNIPVVSSAAIQELIQKRNKANVKAYLVDLSGLSISGNATGVTGGTWGVSQSAAQAEPLSAAEKYHKMPVANGKKPWKNGYARPLDASTEWLGAITVPGPTSTTFGEPIALSVTQFFPSGEWLGMLSMPTNGTKVFARGILIPGGGPPMENGERAHTIYIHTEHELIAGADKRLKDMQKRGHLDTCARAIKFVEHNNPIITLSYVQHTPAVDLAFLQPGTTWKGTAPTETASFTLQVQKRETSQFEGTIAWNDIGVTTSCKGSIGAQGELEFEETGVVGGAMEEDGDVEMPPTKYACRPVLHLSPLAPHETSFNGRWTATLNGSTTFGTVALKPVNM